MEVLGGNPIFDWQGSPCHTCSCFCFASAHHRASQLPVRLVGLAEVPVQDVLRVSGTLRSHSCCNGSAVASAWSQLGLAQSVLEHRREHADPTSTRRIKIHEPTDSLVGSYVLHRSRGCRSFLGKSRRGTFS